METTVTERKETASRAKLPGISRLGWWVAACLIVIIFLVATTGRNLPVMLPVMAAVGADVFFLWFLWRKRRGEIPFFEIGAVYVAVVSLYTLYPLIGYISNGLSYTPFNDNRLYLAQPGPQEIGTVGWYHVVHLLAFIVAYLLARGRLPLQQARFRNPGRVTVLAAVMLYLAISGFFLALGVFYDLSASTYAESYLVSRRLPLLLAQFWNHLDGARFTLALVIMAALFGNYRKYRLLIVGWLALVALMAFGRLGSRTELVLLLISAAVMYHYLVRPMPFRWLVLAGISGLSIFVLFGWLRGGQRLFNFYLGFNPFAYASEFETLFGNAFDLSRLKVQGAVGDLAPTFYLADLLALVPQQLLPIAKISPSVWYVNTFYPAYAAAGGGLAFGTISESILGSGWVDLAARGAALGFILTQVHRFYATRRPTFWTFIFYVWVTVQVYQSFRNTTFFLLVLFFYRFLPVMIGTKVLSTLLRRGVRTVQRPLPVQA